VSRSLAILHVQSKFKGQRIATYVRWWGCLYLVDESQTDRFLITEFEITIVWTPLLYQII